METATVKITLGEIEAAVHGRLLGEDRLVEAVSIDTRTLQKGDLYVAIPGGRFDGHDFLAEAEQAGAAAVISERQTSVKVPQIIVASTRQALAEMAGYWRGRLALQVAGVTGSNGKTTVKEMIAAILGVKGKVLYTQGNLNNDIGVPMTLLRLDAGHRYAVIEMGANHPGEIAHTSRYARADVVVITNVGAAHIEGFGDLRGVAEAKGEIITSLAADGVAVINRDDAFYDYWLQLAGSRRTVSFGLQQRADVRAENITTHKDEQGFESVFDLCHQSGRLQVRLPLAGLHNVRNALAASAVCLELGMENDQIKTGLAAMKAVTGRLQPLFGRLGNMIIDDTYNANPDSLKAALEVLMQSHGEPWLVLGSFGELGPDSAIIHREMGEMCKTMGVARMFAVGPDARACTDAFGEKADYYATQEALITALQNLLTGRETLLIKGSRARKMENVAAALVENYRA